MNKSVAFENSTAPDGDQCRYESAPAPQIAGQSERGQLSSAHPSGEALNWHGAPLYKQLLLALIFLAAFLVSDGSSTASQGWEGAPPCYLPVALSLALLLCGGMRYVPLVYVSSLVAAVVNYHRPLFSWCGIPGVTALYAWYVGAAAILRGRLRIDPKLASLRDVGRYVLTLLIADTFNAIVGMLTLLGDGLLHRSDAIRAMVDWWASDAIAIITVTPFLLIFVAPWVGSWLKAEADIRSFLPLQPHLSRPEILEMAAQWGSVLLAIWLVFGFTPAIPYQPLYLLFIPVIWVAVRRGQPGGALTTFAITFGMTFGAWVTRAERGSLPRLQLAMLALGVTGLCVGAMVTERKRAERALQRSEAGLKEAQRVARLGSWTMDPKTEQTTWTDELYRMLGFDSSLPPPLFLEQERIFTPDSWIRLTTEFDKTLRTGVPYELELETVRPDGSKGWILVRGEPQRNAKGTITGMSGVAQDITDRKVTEQRVQFLAYYDALTGLPNRTLLRDRLAKALAGARRQNDRVALLFLDLDRFKIINDSLGHSVGDLLLQEVAGRLKKWAREHDTVARVGGDEFLIVLSAIKDIADAAVAAERIVGAMTSEFVVQGHSLNIRCSLGISIFPEHGMDGETLIKNADAAMYSAKESGRNMFRFFTEEMNTQALERLTLENSLRMALERNELFLMYQPQVDISSGKIAGLEALIRWQHPEMGLVPTDKFIRVAENTGLIIPIGEWVLKTACSQARKWQEEGLLAVSIAVNVSAIQFRQEGFRELIKRVLQETGIAPQFLELELTESLLLTNADVMFSVLQELKDMGLKLAIDDFGTGYSSLSYLRRFPVSKLKIDRLFIRDVATSPDDAAITTAIISMAKSLNLKVIAEGVETEAQMSFLRAHECDEIQGYYFSKPLRAEQVADKLRSPAIPALAVNTNPNDDVVQASAAFGSRNETLDLY
jgi:diguanylate cyclase (GGDEF)-like protein